uniref:Uncharacterized protein n=1 Tax=Anopheles quadriannulatus TaxID=34691 RepID=A0A182XPF3_ANOQN
MEKSNAGNGSFAESIAIQNNRQLHTLTNMISDVHLKLDEVLVQQQQLLTQPSPNSNDDHSVPVEQETEFVFALIASESALEEFDKSLNLEEQFVKMKEWLIGNIDVGDKGVEKFFVSKFSNAKTGAKKQAL